MIGLIPSRYKDSNSSNSAVSLILPNIKTLSSASERTLFFNFSKITFGFTPIYFTGFPNFSRANPRFSKPSKTSYVLDLGTPERSATSRAEAIPFESRASHTLAS